MTADPVLMDWPDAMRAVTDGLAVRREIWDDVACQVKLMDGFLQIHIQGEWKHWIVSSSDIFARDWTLA